MEFHYNVRNAFLLSLLTHSHRSVQFARGSFHSLFLVITLSCFRPHRKKTPLYITTVFFNQTGNQSRWTLGIESGTVCLESLSVYRNKVTSIMLMRLASQIVFLTPTFPISGNGFEPRKLFERDAISLVSGYLEC